MSTIEDGISKALSYLNIQREGRILLKKEQETATKELLSGNDVLAVLPTGFGKSLIYTIFTLAREEIMSTNTCAIIVSPLKSIIDDQIAEMESLNCKSTRQLGLTIATFTCVLWYDNKSSTFKLSSTRVLFSWGVIISSFLSSLGSSFSEFSRNLRDFLVSKDLLWPFFGRGVRSGGETEDGRSRLNLADIGSSLAEYWHGVSPFLSRKVCWLDQTGQ